MNKDIDSIFEVKKIGCAWSSQIGKVVGRFMVLPIEEKTQVDTRDYYLCEFMELVFIRVIEGDKYINILQLPDKLKEEVNFLIGSKKIISGDVLRNGTLVYITRPI